MVRSPGFIIKAYAVDVQGFPEAPYFGASPQKVMANAWRDFDSAGYGTSFRDFLKIARVRRRENPEGDFGREILVNGRRAFFVSSNLQYIRFVDPGSDLILNVHPYDVLPEEVRPSTYRSAT